MDDMVVDDSEAEVDKEKIQVPNKMIFEECQT